MRQGLFMFLGNMKRLWVFVLTRFPRRTGIHFGWKRFSLLIDRRSPAQAERSAAGNTVSADVCASRPTRRLILRRFLRNAKSLEGCSMKRLLTLPDARCAGSSA
jgi:hypothetical protein